MKDKKHNHEENCKCNENCNCEGQCKCDEENKCDENCTCGEEKCQKNCSCGEDKVNEYLDMAKRLQAEFENYRKRTFFELKKAKEDGEINVIEVFLPCLDTFKVAKKSITDPKVLEGVEMIENNISQALEKIGVQKIESVGQKYDPNLHNVIAIANVADKENDNILDEYQAGYKYNDRVIRYSKVIVNKKED